MKTTMSRSATSDNIKEVQQIELDSARRHRVRTVLLTMKMHQNQYFLEKINMFKDEENNASVRNFDVVKEVGFYCVSFGAIAEQRTAIPHKVPTRSVPNILRNSTKASTLIEIKQVPPYAVDTEDCSEASFNSIIAPENISLKETAAKVDQNKYNIKMQSHRRKQVYNPTDIRQDSPDWTADRSSMKSTKSIEKQTQLTCRATQTKEGRLSKKRKQSAEKMSPSKEMDEVTCSSSREAKDFICRTTDLSFLEYGEEANLHNPIDFSSNDIFNNEFYNSQCADYFEGFITHSDGECDSASRTLEQCTSIKECDINGNNVDICEVEKWPLMTNEGFAEKGLDRTLPIINGSFDGSAQDTRNDKLMCGQINDTYCNEYYASCHKMYLPTNNSCEGNSDEKLDFEDEVFAFNEDTREICSANFSFIAPRNETEHKSNREDSNFAITPEIELSSNVVSENDIRLEWNALIEECTNEYSSNSYIEEESSSNADLQNCTFVSLETSEYTPNTIGLRTMDVNDDISDENDFNMLKGNEIEVNNYTYPNVEISESMEREVKNMSDEKNQCLLCPLTFKTARSMALHQAGAHGGAYAILCERCGRLFNKKYNFSRHLVQCGRQKLPFNCDMCIKVYRHKSSLVHHLKTAHHVQYVHNSSKTFTCDTCSKMYSKFGAFKNHVNRHKCIW